MAAIRPSRKPNGKSLCLQATASLKWVTANIERFAAFPSHEESDSKTVGSFAELAIVYAYAEAWREQLAERVPLGRYLPTWRTLIITQCEREEYAEMARKSPLMAYYFLLPYLMLRTTGYRSPYYEQTLRFARRWGYPMASETVPYRILDRHFFFWKSGYSRREPKWYELYRHTALGNRCSPAYMDVESAYSVTHTIFYLTDFGNRPAPLPVKDIDYITHLLDPLLVHYWRVGNWDLIGELLVAMNCVSHSGSIVSEAAAHAFVQVWRPDGMVAANVVSAAALLSTGGLGLDELHFRSCYHTTLVALLYAFTALRCRRRC